MNKFLKKCLLLLFFFYNSQRFRIILARVHIEHVYISGVYIVDPGTLL